MATIFKVDFDPTVTAKAYSENIETAQKLLSQRVLIDSNRYIPKRTGRLHRSGHIDNQSVVWDVPYASIMYYRDLKKPVSTAVNPLARSHWFDFAKLQYLDAWVEESLEKAGLKGVLVK